MDRIIEKRKWPQRRVAWIAIAILVPTAITHQLDYEVLDGLSSGEQVIISSYENFGDVDKLILK